MTITNISIFKILVPFDSTSRNSNLPLIEWAAGLSAPAQRACGPHSQRREDQGQCHGEPRPRARSRHGCIWSYRCRAGGLSGLEQRSFRLTGRNGRVYRRHSSYIEGFIAGSLAALDCWRRLPLQRPLHFAFSLGCFGAHSLVERIARSISKPPLIIVGEPLVRSPCFTA